jgi:hypothetical protein
MDDFPYFHPSWGYAGELEYYEDLPYDEVEDESDESLVVAEEQ